MSLPGQAPVALVTRHRPALGIRVAVALALSALFVAAALAASPVGSPWRTVAFLLGPLVSIGLVMVWRTRDVGLVGPLFYYDLARLARRGRSTQLRSLYLVILTVALGGLSIGYVPDVGAELSSWASLSAIQTRAVFARASVRLVFFLQMGALLLLTPGYLAGAFAEDKERKSLHFLFVTDLRDHELVLGRLFGRLTLLGIILLVGLPFLSLCLAYGPVDFSFVFIGIAASALAMLSMGSISILCSVLCRTMLGAVLSSYILVIVMNLVLLGAPAVSPLYVVIHCEEEVAREWNHWEEEVEANFRLYPPTVRGGLAGFQPPKIPAPNTASVRLWALLPYAVVHGLIFVFCAGVSIQIVREACLSPGHTYVSPEFLPKPLPPPEPAPAGIPKEEQALPPSLPGPMAPVKDPALLWKEMEFGDISLPAPSLAKLPGFLLRPAALVVLGTIAAMFYLGWFYLRWRLNVEQVSDSAKGGAELVGYATVICMGVWSLLVAFRVAGSVTREREQDTLQGLLMLPVERDEILHAKWLGGILRFGQLGYLLGAIWLVGLLTGVLHPLSLILLFAACLVYLAFIGSVGLWISLASRSTLWANLSAALALMLCFSGSGAKAVVDNPDFRSQIFGWLRHAPEVLVNPSYALFASAFTWQEMDNLPAPKDLESLWQTAPVQPEPPARVFLRNLLMIPVNLLFFAGTAWAFWQLSRWQFKKSYC